jgi:chromosomal replication initiator protein
VVNGVFSIPLETVESPVHEPSEQDSTCRIALREYIGGDENRLVQFVVESILSGSCDYNPILLCGRCGTGKTLLAAGIAHCWRRKYPNRLCTHVTGTEFHRGYRNAVDTDSLAEFRQRLGAARLFVMDNLDELQGKESAQQEFLILLDELLDHRSMVLLTSRQESELSSLFSPMLVSRLAAGLRVALLPPGDAARRILLSRLAAHHQISLPDSVLELLVENMTQRDGSSTVPELNHVLLQLSHIAAVQNQEIDREFVVHFLSHQLKRETLSLRKIAERTARKFSVPPDQLRSSSRRRNVVRARGVAMLLCRTLTDNSLKSIGRYFGKRDHTTVLHACRKTEAMKESDPEISAAIDELMGKLQSL